MPWKARSFTALCLAVAVTLHAAENPDAPQDAEPPLRMEVQIEGKTVTAEQGKPVDVEIEGKKLSLQIKVLPHRQFDRAGVRFLYPTSHAWEVDRDEPGVTIYTMDGNDSIIMLMKYNAPLTPKEAEDAMLLGLTGTFGRNNVKRVPATFKAKAQTLAGTRLQVDLAGETIHQDVFGFKADGATCLLMLQDTIDDEGKPTKEMQELRDLLTKTFELKPASP